ncbi:hypothetical protein [Parapedobacter sp. DT-150]|uniref:hypothetical protein n=1 Tax=Parapedobacter sp. DT-150 TaxID=3396162 RepID=UPI003F1B4755
MNFLSHYYFERYSHNPEQVLGSVLPDLIRSADRDIHVLPQKHEDQLITNPKLQSIYHGWMRHMEIDRYFHNSPFFYTHTHELKLVLAPAVEGTAIRPSFLSHIALELLLDHLLLHNDWVHESDFYAYLGAADRGMTDRFLKLCEVPDTHFFFVHFDGFMQARYLSDYWEFDKITLAMEHICRRLWEVRLSDDQRHQITRAIGDYAARLDGNFHPVFDEIRRELT